MEPAAHDNKIFQSKPNDQTFTASCSTDNHSVFIDFFFEKRSPCFLNWPQKTNKTHDILARIFLHLAVATCIHSMFLLVHWTLCAL